MADRLRTNSPDAFLSKMCFACRKTSPRYGDGLASCDIVTMWNLPNPVQLGVTMPKKTYQQKRVADTASTF